MTQRVTLVGLRDVVVRLEREVRAQGRAQAQANGCVAEMRLTRPVIDRHAMEREVASATFDLVAQVEDHRKRIEGLHEVITELLRRVASLEENRPKETSTYSAASVGPTTSSFENVAGHLIFHEPAPTRRARRRKKR